MIVKKIPLVHAPIFTFPDALSKGIKKLLLTTPFGKVFIVNDDRVLLGYYSFENYKESGTFDLQLDTVCLQEDEVSNGQTEVFVPLSAGGTDLGILPIVGASGRVTGAAMCCTDAMRGDMIDCLAKLKYLSKKNLSLEYWFLAKNYKKVAFWGLDELSLAFAEEILHYKGIKTLGIYECIKYKMDITEYPLTTFYFDRDSDMHYVETMEDVFESDADLVIVTDWAMRHLEDLPRITNTHTDVIYASKILDLHSAVTLYLENSDSLKDLSKTDVTQYVNTEIFSRYKAKYRAMGCNLLTVAIPYNRDLNISEHRFVMYEGNIARRLAEWNGWEPGGKEVAEFMKGYDLINKSVIKAEGYVYIGDIKSKYINYMNKCRVIPNVPAAYKNTVYIVGSCIAIGTFWTDEQTLGYYLQENINNRGLEYRVVSVGSSNDVDRYYHMKLLDAFDIKEGDIIFWLDGRGFQSEWDLDLTPVYEELYKKHGVNFLMDIPVHSSKDATKAVADFLIAHIDNPFVSEKHTVSYPTFSDNPQLKEYQEFIKSNAIHKTPKIGSIVMNCNPFTLGHQYLIEYAAKQVDYLYIFVVEEDKSLFKFEDRIELVKVGTSHLKNVKVLPSGQFIISTLTFSTYFDKENTDGATIDTSLDVETFGSQIAPCLNISVRFVGEEPLDPVTSLYNRSMKEILPKYGVELCEIPRREIDGEVISASRVRKCLEEKNWEEIRKLVPETTYSFLEANYSTD